jgi:hypothetical protein
VPQVTLHPDPASNGAASVEPINTLRHHPGAERPQSIAAAIEPLLLTLRQAAAALSVSERTLWALTYPRGPIPAVRLGRAVRYDVLDLRAFIEAQKRR